MNAMLAKPDGLLALIDDHSREGDTMKKLNGNIIKTIFILITFNRYSKFVRTQIF